MIKGFITSTDNYNNGILSGTWIDFPFTPEQQYYFNGYEYNIDPYDPKTYFFSDFESDALDVDDLDEHASIDDMNELVETLEAVDAEAVAAVLEAEGGTLQEALERVQNDKVIFYAGQTLEDVAWQLFEECYAFDLPEFAVRYFDVEAFARDLSFDGYTELSGGVIYIG